MCLDCAEFVSHARGRWWETPCSSTIQLWWLTLRAPLGLDEAKMRSMSMVLSMRPSSLQSRHSLLNLGPSSSSRCCRVPKLAKLQKIFFRSSAHPPSHSQHLSLAECIMMHGSR